MSSVFLALIIVGLILLFTGLIVATITDEEHHEVSVVFVIVFIVGIVMSIFCFWGWIITGANEVRSNKIAETTAAIEQIYSSEANGILYGVPDYAAKEILINYIPNGTNALLVMQDYSKNWSFRYFYNAKDPKILQAVKNGWTLVTDDNKLSIITS